MNLCDPGFQPQSALKLFNSFIHTSLPDKHAAQIKVRFGITRIHSNGSIKVFDSFFKLAIHGEQQAKVVMAVGIVGSDREGLAVVPNRLIMPSASGNVSRQVIVREARIWVDLKYSRPERLGIAP